MRLKKVFILAAAVMMAMPSLAQFQEGKGYVGASLSGLDLNYKGTDGLNLGLEAKGGYFFADDLMLLGMLSYEHNGNDAVADHFTLGAGARYYIVQNGLFLGANLKWLHANHNYNDLMPGVEIGYAFFINRSVTVEPSVYYDQSFRRHKDYSTVGLRIGVGIYLFDD
ncbi:MAG: hypothetical protein SPI30_06310 [Prevotella sp.]|nr:hypothetical protein [Prevotella sp.]